MPALHPPFVSVPTFLNRPSLRPKRNGVRNLGPDAVIPQSSTANLHVDFFNPVKDCKKSMGSGKTMVEFFSVPISVNVCK